MTEANNNQKKDSDDTMLLLSILPDFLPMPVDRIDMENDQSKLLLHAATERRPEMRFQAIDFGKFEACEWHKGYPCLFVQPKTKTSVSCASLCVRGKLAR